ncbi:MAG: hypothetical protein J0H57_18980, partial [Rhodospirillales bacterium]|nr:hypothetical protein [Rhodospirillales bacterium]
MLMPLLVRLTDSEIEATDGVVAQIADPIDDGLCVPEEISPGWLLVDQEALLSDLHVDPIHWDIEPDSELWRAEHARVVGPPGASVDYWHAGVTTDPPYCDWQHPVFAVRGAMAFPGEDGSDFTVRNAVTGEIEYPIKHFCPSREFADRVDFHFDFEISHLAAAPDDPDPRDIMLAAIKHDFLDEAAQQCLTLSIHDGWVCPDVWQAASEVDNLAVQSCAHPDFSHGL